MNVQCPNCGVEASIPDEFEDSLAEYACGECGSSYIEEEVHSEEPSP